MWKKTNVPALLTVVATLFFLGCTSTTDGASSANNASTPEEKSEPSAPKLTMSDVTDAQRAWGEGIVAIAAEHTNGGDYRARATEHINTLYAYGVSDVMFKPTLAAEDQFRESFDEALSYFVGTPDTEDSGFAIKGWTNVRWENNAVYTDSDSGMAMGNYYFTGPDGSETKVEYSFGYIVGSDGKLKINLHHSSLPYNPQ